MASFLADTKYYSAIYPGVFLRKLHISLSIPTIKYNRT